MPARVEVARDVADDRAFEPHRRVVPAEPVAGRVIVRVEPVSRQRSQVDPADERGLVVDDDQLLVVAVERPLPRVERHRDARAAGELVARLPHLSAVRVEERQRRACPGEDAHVDSLRRLGQELAQRRPFRPRAGTRRRSASRRDERASVPSGSHPRCAAAPRPRRGTARRDSRRAARRMRFAPSRRRAADRSPPRCRGAAASGRGGRERHARSSPRRDRRGGSGDMEPRRVHARAAKNLTRSARRTCCRCRRR